MKLTQFFKYLYWILIGSGLILALTDLLTPSYLDHAQPLVALTSWVTLKQGLPFFHPSDFSSIYNLMYGPFAFISHWPAFVLLGGSFFASKITGFIFFCGTLVLFFRLLQKIKPELYRYVLAIYFFTWILGCDDFFYNNRTDVFIFFWTLFAANIFWSKKIKDLTKLILTTAIIGICFNYKIHSVLYVAPFAGILALRNIKHFVLSALIFIIVAALPWFFFPGQFEVYYGILKNLSRVMGSTEIRQVITMNVVAIVFFLALFRPRFQPKDRIFLLLSLIAIVLGSLFAMREGSGKNQMIPLIASYLNFILRAQPRDFQKKYAWGLTLAMIYLIACLVKDQKDIVVYFTQFNQLAQKELQIKDLVKDLPERSILWIYSDGRYADSYLRPQIYFSNKGSNFIVDVVTLMENDHGGIVFPQASLNRLASCQSPYAIAAKGDTYGKLTSFYRPVNVFPDQWSETFMKHYQPLRESADYILWQCH